LISAKQFFEMSISMSVNLVGYLRVSTRKQGDSGLGMEAQRNAVEVYARQSGGIVVKIYTEVESGKKNDRPELHRALAHCRRLKATLVVAKLDRLSRNAAFLLALQEGKVPLACCDNPHANELTIGLLAVIAQHEARMISKRTKEALQAAKARGVKLGSRRPGHWDGREDRRLGGLEKARLASVEAKANAAAEAYSDLEPMIREFRMEGASLQAIADRLNSDGYTTRRDAAFTPMTIHRIIQRAG
jgi:DNA invertase Pin-like site-specific DNA recombinase